MYELHSVLWDAQHVQHFNKNVKHDAWSNISVQMSEDIDTVKKKMTSLLGSFRREKSKTKNSQSTGKGKHIVIIITLLM